MEPESAILKPEPDAWLRSTVMLEIAASLHDLCQPLTALQCRLEIGQMFGTPEAYREAVTDGLRESERLLLAVTALRELVQQRLEQS